MLWWYVRDWTENPLMTNDDEQSVASEIERDLAEVGLLFLVCTGFEFFCLLRPYCCQPFIQLYDCIQQMRSCNGGSPSSHQEVLIKRYYEIHFDYSTEFKNTSVSV